MIESNRLYPSYPHSVKIPGGATAHVFVTESPVRQPDGSFKLLPTLVQCNIGRVGTRMAGYGITVSRLCTELLNQTSLDECIAVFSDLSIDLAELEITANSETARSLPEAFAIALRHYRSLKQETSS